jgi:prevent-host-death family protein
MKQQSASNSTNRRTGNVISAVAAQAKLAEILKRASEKDERFVVDRPGRPGVIIMSVRDYIRTIAPPHPAFASIRKESKKNGTSELKMADIDREVAAHRRQAKKRRIQASA